jgi:hypothetical protein
MSDVFVAEYLKLIGRESFGGNRHFAMLPKVVAQTTLRE